MSPQGPQPQLDQRRRRAVELLDKGSNPPDVAKKIGCSLSSVYYWNELRKKKGQEALKSKPVPGRPERLTGRQKRSLVKILVAGPLKQGYTTELWTLKRISKVIDKSFDVEYHPSHVWKILQDLGWGWRMDEDILDLGHQCLAQEKASWFLHPFSCLQEYPASPGQCLSAAPP